jgi:alpha-1,3-rhamnosyl/mannosyltransferase
MRVALFVPQLGVSGGLGVYCRSLLDGLRGLAETDELYVFAPADPRRLFPKSGLDEGWRRAAADPKVRMVPVDWPADHPLSLTLDAVIGPAVSAARPDIFHATYYSGLERPPCPQAVTFHDAGFLEFPAVFGETRRQRLETFERIRPAVSRLLCVSADARDRVCRLLPFDPARADFVHLPVSDDPADLAAAMRAESARTPLWAGGDSAADWGPYVFLPVGAATGFNRVRKNVPTAVRAFRRLAPAGIRLVIASTAILHDKLLHEVLPPEEIAAGTVVGEAWRSGDDAVRLVPDLERGRFLSAMAHARLVVYPSRYEGFGLPPVEAMALGVPVVAGRAASIPEVVGDAGLLVDPDDADGFAAAMGRVLAEPALAADLVARGRARAARFTVGHFGRGSRECYARALGGRVTTAG